MRYFVGKLLNFPVYSLNAYGFINIHDYFKVIICISDLFVTILFLGFNLKASLVL